MTRTFLQNRWNTCYTLGYFHVHKDTHCHHHHLPQRSVNVHTLCVQKRLFHQVYLQSFFKCNELEQPCSIDTDITDTTTNLALQHISSPPLLQMTYHFQHHFSEGRYAPGKETEREREREVLHVHLLPVCLTKEWVSEGVKGLLVCFPYSILNLMQKQNAWKVKLIKFKQFKCMNKHFF